MITHWKIFHYAIPLFLTPLLREGFLLYIESDKGTSSWGEIAPLAGWNKESMSDALAELEQLKLDLLHKDFSLAEILKLLAAKNLSPSVSFGVESAVLSLYEPIILPPLPISALLAGTYEEIQRQLPLLWEKGYASAKLKVSQLNLEEAASLIDLLKDKIRLRIDVNRIWSTELSLSFFSRYPQDAFDYIEEPCSEPDHFDRFVHPIALDETLREKSIEEISLLPNVKALIIKPTMQGAPSCCKALAEFAKKQNIDLSLSSSFETGIGLFHVASFVSRLSLPVTPLGLDTYRFLFYDILQNPHSQQGGHMHFSSMEPNIKNLNEVAYV